MEICSKVLGANRHETDICFIILRDLCSRAVCIYVCIYLNLQVQFLWLSKLQMQEFNCIKIVVFRNLFLSSLVNRYCEN